MATKLEGWRGGLSGRYIKIITFLWLPLAFANFGDSNCPRCVASERLNGMSLNHVFRKDKVNLLRFFFDTYLLLIVNVF